MNNTIQFIIYLHAALGAIALLSGAIALLAKKGSPTHVKLGLVFYYSMLISAIVAMIIACLPNHENTFLFSIGIFSIYLILMGRRSIRFKNKHHTLGIEKIISATLFLTGVGMVIYSLFLSSSINVVMLVFGFISIGIAIKDYFLYQNNEIRTKKYLSLHLGKMTGGYIAAVSAFFVVNQILPGVWNWFAPGVVGSILLTIYARKKGY